MKRILLITAVCILGIGAYFMIAPLQSENMPETAQAQIETDTPDTDQPVTQETDSSTPIQDMMIGNPDAKVTVIEYASFTCPHCASFHNSTFKELKKNYIDTHKINFIYREIYFDRYGLWASMIARCAGPDKFFGMTDLMFKSQSVWARAGEPAQIIAELRKIGRLAGMNEGALDQCLEDEAQAKNLVAWYQENAGRDDITSTPSFVINGTKYSNMNISEMSKILDEALGL